MRSRAIRRNCPKQRSRDPILPGISRLPIRRTRESPTTKSSPHHTETSLCEALVPILAIALLAGWYAPLPAQEKLVAFRFLEAEDCDGVLRYPYDNEELGGWYAREASCRGYGAPGRSYCAAIHENAPVERRSMSQKLSAPLPAGSYRAFLRVVGPMSATPGEESLVRVQIGAGTADFAWNNGSKRFAWLPGVDLTLPAPADTVSFTAVKFGGNGHGAIHEPLNRSIWLDTLYLTTDLDEKTPPDLAMERAMQARVSLADLAERPAYQADDRGPDDQVTPKPESPVHDDPILLQAFDGRKNLWRNSSFELGMNDGWSSAFAPVKHVFTDQDLDDRTPFHGKYSLRISAGANPFSHAYYLPKPGRMTLSLHVRGDPAPVSAALLQVEGNYKSAPIPDRMQVKRKTALKLTGTSANDWQRLSAIGDLAEGWYYLSLTCAKELWLDAAQLFEGEGVTAFTPRAELEAGLSTGQLGNILYEDKKTLKAWFHNSSEAGKSARLRYRIVDVRDRVVAEGTTESMDVPAGQTITRDVAIVPELRGMFSVAYALDGRKLPEGELVYVRMPKPPDQPARHELGGNMSFDTTELALHKRLGLKWALTCKTREVGAAGEFVHRKPDEWNWVDESAGRPRKMGMDVIPCFWPGRIPEFMAEKPSKPCRPSRGAYRTNVPKPDLWQDYVGKVAAHYEPAIKRWCVDDEAECSWDPVSHAELVRLTAEAVRKSAPGVKIGISAIPDFTEEMLCHISPDSLDFFGGSTFDHYYWECRKVRRLRERYNKPWVCYGVGNRTINTMYHTLYCYQPVWWNAARMGRRVVELLVAQGLEISGHYAALLRNDGAHIAKNKPLCGHDGTPLPWGATFGCLGTLLADAVELGDVPLGDSGLRAHLFRKGETLGAVTWSTCVPSYDHYWRPAVREISGISLECPKGSVAVMDMYWNELPNPRWDGQSLKLDLNEEPTFLLDRTLGEAAFTAMLRQAKAPARPVEVSTAFVPTPDGKIGVGVTVRNNSANKLETVTVDLRPPGDGQPFSMAGEWLLARPVGAIPEVQPGKSETVVLPTVLDGRQPYETGRLRVNLRAKDGIETASDHWFWIVPAFRAKEAPTIDGDLREYEGRNAAWLAYDWSWALFGRHLVQLHENGEVFSYPPYRLDARAAFWLSYDATRLYIGIRLEDDQPILDQETGESVRLVLGVAGANRCVLDLRPRPDGSVAVGHPPSADQSVTSPKPRADGAMDTSADVGKLATGDISARSKADKTSVRLEASIPWSGLAADLALDAILDFDLFWTDVDREENQVVAGTLRWSGGESPTGFLFLSDHAR